MGKVAAIAVGIVAFFAVLATGNAVGAVIFGVVMFAMAYGAFAWKPGERQPGPGVLESGPPPPPLPPPSAPLANEGSKMQTDFSAQEQAVVNTFALQLEQLGLPETEARKSSSNLVAEVISELRPHGIDLLKSTQGEEYATREDFFAPRLAVGLTLDDIRFHWNRPLLIVFCEVKMRELVNFIYVDIARQQGRDLVEAGNEYKRNFPRYGNPQRWDPTDKFNQGLRPQDADIYQEFAARVDSWRRRVGEASAAEAIAAHGTMNAAIRALVKARQL